MNDKNQDRYVVELIPPSDKVLVLDEWEEHVKEIFFFKNQQLLFGCFLIKANSKLYLSFKIHNELSRQFMEFVLRNLPKKTKDRKKRHFKYIKNMYNK